MAQSTVDSVLGEEGQTFGDLANGRLDDEAVVSALSVGEKVVKDHEGVRTVLEQELERVGVPVLYADRGRGHGATTVRPRNRASSALGIRWPRPTFT